MKRIAKEFLNDRVKCLHIFTMPGVSEQGFYRAAVSYNAFSRRQSARHNKARSKRIPVGRWFYLTLLEEFEADKEREIKILGNGIYDHLETVEHPDIWAFYTYIGYDHKKGIYPETPLHPWKEVECRKKNTKLT